jgi:hypothetical protein
MRGRFSVPFLVVALAVLATGCGSTIPSPIGSAPSQTPAVAASVPSPITPAPSPTESATVPATLQPIAADWPLYHLDAGRTGNQLAFPAFSGSLSVAWSVKLDGAVYAQPLVVGGHVIAVTENDSVYALDPGSGSVLWRQHLGTPVRLSTLPCGNIDPLGITGTPAFDSATGSLFFVAEVAGPHHVLFALDPSTGSVRWSRGIDLAGDSPVTHQQRPALAVANG